MRASMWPMSSRAWSSSADGAEPGSTGKTIRGPRLPRLVQTWMGVQRPVSSRLQMRERYGPVFATRDAIMGVMYHVGDRSMVERMFKWKPPEYNVAEPREVMEPVTGPTSLLLLDGAHHIRMRKLMLPPFHGDAIAHYDRVIEEVTSSVIDEWRPGQTLRMRSVAQAVTLEVIIRAVFGITDGPRVDELKRLLPGLSSPSPFLLFMQRDLGPRSPWGRFLRRRDRVDELLYDEIRRRRDDPESDERRDILALLLSARDDEGHPLSDRELRDELITILLAGHETTATSIGWAFERLLRHPAALARLTEEVQAGEGTEYMDAVAKETLRVRPVITEVFRAPSERTELGGYVFEADCQMAASIILVQLDPELYAPDPMAFRPERFLDGAPEPYTWIPFGGGVRRCLGASFAQLEMKVAIATILRRARLRAPRARDEKARFRGVTLLPSRGGEAIVESVGQPSRRPSQYPSAAAAMPPTTEAIK
jgi:cytochrome P450 family 135